MRRRDQRGSTIPLIVGFTVVLLLAAAVVIDVSAAWLRRQSLDNLADGAALHAADRGAEGTEVYRDGLGTRLRLDDAVARRAVADYLRAAGSEYDGLDFSVTIDGDRVRVTVRAPMELPLTFPGASASTRVSGHGAASVSVDE